MALNCRGGEPRQLLEVEQPPPWPDRAAVVDPSRHFEPSICCDAQWLPFDMIGYRSRVLGAAHEATGIHHDCRECRGLLAGAVFARVLDCQPIRRAGVVFDPPSRASAYR
jgi:hypothetical protein